MCSLQDGSTRLRATGTALLDVRKGDHVPSVEGCPVIGAINLTDDMILGFVWGVLTVMFLIGILVLAYTEGRRR